MTEKKIWFDMDGTLADFYGVDNWLNYLEEKNPYPYMVAKPLCSMSWLARMIHELQAEGYEVGIISWLAKNSNEDFDALVTEAKMIWLKKHLPSVTFNEIHIVTYGTPKQSIGTGFLFDDEFNNRISWSGIAYSNENIIRNLKDIVDNCYTV